MIVRFPLRHSKAGLPNPQRLEKSGNIQAINQITLNLLEYQKDELIGKSIKLIRIKLLKDYMTC